MNVREKITEAITALNELDEYDSTLNDRLYQCDKCYRIIRELHKIRIERRKIKNDIELMKTYRQNQQKLLNCESRKFIIPEIGKMEKQLNSTYKNRVYTEEELKEMVGV